MKIAFYNLGCKVNAYETEVIKNKFILNGFDLVDFNDNADIYVVNTCSVTHIADRKSRNILRRCKKNNKNSIVVAVGCFVNSLNEDEKLKLSKDIDIFITNNDKNNIVFFIENYIKEINYYNSILDINNDKNKEIRNEKSNKISNDINNELNIEINNEIINDLSHDTNNNLNFNIRKFLKIQDGCNQYCSYCIIPYLRSNLYEKPISLVLNEANDAVENGAKEIVLTGIHLSSYKNINKLLIEIAKIEGLLRIRIGSLEPRIINDNFLNIFDNKLLRDKFCFEFHLSLQSASNNILKKMNRHYTKEEYKKSCDLIRKNFNNTLISTDIIVGFPGESDEDFNETLNFVKEIKFYNPHIFSYSKRKGTKASLMTNQIADSIKKQREKILINESNIISNNIKKTLLNSKREILVEEIIENVNGTFLSGFTKEYVKVLAKGDKYLLGAETLVKLVDIKPNYILANCV